MPPKRPSQLEQNPPSASSTDEESGTEGESGSEDEQEQPKPIQSSIKKPPPPNPQSSSEEEDEEEEDGVEEEEKKTNLTADDEEEDSDSDSESDNESLKHMIAPRNAVEVKPISSKPMSEIPIKKHTSNAKNAAKRPAPAEAEEEEEEENDKKRKKKKVSDIEEEKVGGGGEEKKAFFVGRIFSDEDEIILLNKLIEFKKDEHIDMSGFFDYVKDSLHCSVNKSQLNNKIQRLEKKYKNNAKKGKNGNDPVISKPHELKSYLLSKEIWGNQAKSNGVPSTKGKVAKTVKPPPKVESVEEEVEEDTAMEEVSAGGVEYLYLNQSTQSSSPSMLPTPPQGFAGLVAKKGWGLIGTSNAEAFDKKWKAVLIAETKAYLERIDVVRDQTKLMLDALESSDD